jgi:glycosyltransferase involved in cell wall biosynthesis
MLPGRRRGVRDPGNLAKKVSLSRAFGGRLRCGITWDEGAFAKESRHFHHRERPRILFVGSLAQMYKGPDVLLRAVQLVAKEFNPQVVVIGDGKHRPELEKMAAELGISENVTFLGELPSGQPVRDQLDRATLLVMPSRAEGLPRALIEAMARGVPCIATRVGGIPELLTEEEMVASEDWVGLANKIREVLLAPERLTNMSRRNLDRAQEYGPQVLETRRRQFYRFLRQTTECWSRDGARPLVAEATG